MRKNLFWLSDDQWKQIVPHLPTDVRSKERVDDRRVKDAEELLADKAYDSAELRDELEDRGIKPVIASTKSPTENVTVSRTHSADSEISGALPRATISWLAISSPQSASS